MDTVIKILSEAFFAVLFLSIFIVLFYPQGYYIVQKSKTKLKDHEIVLLSIVPLIIVFVFEALLLSYLGMRFLLLPLNLLLSGYVIYKYKIKIFSPFKVFLTDRILSTLLILAVLIQGFINFPSGYLFDEGLLFWSSQGHDGIWHVALLEEATKSMPYINPLMANLPLYNYHYLIDIFMGEFVRILGVFTSLDAYYRYFPVIFALLINLAVFSLVSRWQKNKIIGYWAMFFTFGVGSFGYIVTYIKSGNLLGGETAFWASQNNTILGNPPHASSFIFLTTFLLAFYLYIKERSRYWLIYSFVIAALLGGFKVSAGVTLLAGLFLAAVVDLVFNKKKSLIFLLIALGVTNLIAVRSMTKEVTSFLIFEPWWFIRTMIVGGDKLDWIDYEMRRQHYVSVGTWKGWARVMQLETQGFMIFLFGNLGMRFIGFAELFSKWIFNFKKSIKDPFEITLLGMLIASFMIPMLFIQKGISYNNIQFVQYFLLIFGFFAATTTYKLINKVNRPLFKYLIALIIIIFSIPTVLGNFVSLSPLSVPTAYLDHDDLNAIQFLKNNTQDEDVVLSVPFDEDLVHSYSGSPQPLYAWYSTAYIPALASRRTFLTSEEQLDIMGYSIQDRVENMKKFFNQSDFLWNREFLAKNNIDYIYVVKGELKAVQWKIFRSEGKEAELNDAPIYELNEEENSIEKIYENDQVNIYKVIL